jgi:hypothetical protein
MPPLLVGRAFAAHYDYSLIYYQCICNNVVDVRVAVLNIEYFDEYDCKNIG